MLRKWMPLVNILALVGLMLLCTSAAWAKQPLVAVILVRDMPRYQAIHDSFSKHFSKSGQPALARVYVQTPNPDLMSLRNSARKAVAIGADLILVYGTLPTLAAQVESFSTPIIFADVFEPAAQGLIPSPERAGRDITGIPGNGPLPTLVKLFQQATAAKQLLEVYDPDDPSSKLQHEMLVETTAKRGLLLTSLAIDCKEPLTGQLLDDPANYGGLYIADGMQMKKHVLDLIGYAHRHGLPVISQIPGLGEQGAFMVLEEDLAEQGQLVAEMVNRYLAGAKIQDLAPVYPRKIAFVVNLDTAREFKIQVPFEVLAVTNRIIR